MYDTQDVQGLTLEAKAQKRNRKFVNYIPCTREYAERYQILSTSEKDYEDQP